MLKSFRVVPSNLLGGVVAANRDVLADLRSLSMSGFNEEAAVALQYLPSLEHLYLHTDYDVPCPLLKNKFVESSLALETWPKLKALVIDGGSMQGVPTEKIPSLVRLFPQLEHLEISSLQVSSGKFADSANSDLQALASLANLKSLKFGKPSTEFKHMGWLRTLADRGQLEWLSLPYSDSSREAFHVDPGTMCYLIQKCKVGFISDCGSPFPYSFFFSHSV